MEDRIVVKTITFHFQHHGKKKQIQDDEEGPSGKKTGTTKIEQWSKAGGCEDGFTNYRCEM
jgi:hypothetical protein